MKKFAVVAALLVGVAGAACSSDDGTPEPVRQGGVIEGTDAVPVPDAPPSVGEMTAVQLESLRATMDRMRHAAN